MNKFKAFCTSNVINGKRVALIALVVSAALYGNYQLSKQIHYHGYYRGCIELANSPLFDAGQADYLTFRCNFMTKRVMWELGSIDEVLLFSDKWPDVD